MARKQKTMETEAVVVSNQQEEQVKDLTDVVPVPMGVQTLLAQAIDKGVGVEVMEKLRAMRKEERAEMALCAFNVALADFQAECPVIVKKRKVIFNGQERYAYAPLEDIVDQVRGLLQKYRFSYTLDTKIEGDWVRAICKVRHEGGHSEESTFSVPVDRMAKMNDSQKVASALTYAKRYAFCNSLGILTGDSDDDAQSTSSQASGAPKAPVRSESPVATPPTDMMKFFPKDGVVLKGNYTVGEIFEAPAGKKARKVVIREFPGVSFYTRHKLEGIKPGDVIECQLKREDYNGQCYYWLAEWNIPGDPKP